MTQIARVSQTPSPGAERASGGKHDTPRLSIVMITRDAMATIRQALESVAPLLENGFAELIVLDSGSRDGTRELCAEFTTRVIDTDWPGFGPQKNRAILHAKGEWVFCLDADEWLSPELRDEIQEVIADPESPSVFRLPQKSRFCGQVMKHSGYWPDYVTRLFRHGAGFFTDHAVHERFEPKDKSTRLGTLREPIDHFAYANPEQVLEKLNRYTTASANMLAQRGKRGSIAMAAIRGLWSFWRCYLLQRGFLDGRRGFLLAVSKAETSFWKHAKLALLENGE